MSARAIVTSGLCAVLVPLVSALPPSVHTSAPFEAWALLEAGLQPAGAATPAASLPVRGSRVETRDAGAGLSAAVDAIQAADAGPAWIAWSVPAIARHDSRDEGWRGEAGRCLLDDEGDLSGDWSGARGEARELVILLRTESRAVTRVTFTDRRCTVEAGARPVYWLTGVAPAQSVALLAALVRDDEATERGGRARRPGRHALPALALHADVSAEAALGTFAAPGQPRQRRKDAAFWLGAARGAGGAVLVERLAREDADHDFREHLTFVLTLTGERGVEVLLDLAKRDAHGKVRAQALFWLGQKAGARAVAALGQAVADDPDREVRTRAVFAISQLPKDDGVPKLIELARTHRDGEVRKQAMFWLGQSGDARAVAFFEDVLKR